MHPFVTGLLLSLSVAATGFGQAKIEGAFGRHLGEEFQPEEGRSEPLEQGATIRCRFKPENPFQGLTDYFVELSPRTHRVCGILASGSTLTEDEAWRLSTLLGIILRNKYPSDPASEEIAKSPEAGVGRIRQIFRRGPAALDEVNIIQGDRLVQVTAYPSQAVPVPHSSQRVFGSDIPLPKPPRAYVSVRYSDKGLVAEAAKEAEAIRTEAMAKEKAAQEARDQAAKEAFDKQREEEERRKAEVRKQIEAKAKNVDSSGL
jgi:hypothetical protein